MNRTERAEWDRMNNENSAAAKTSGTANGRPVVTQGNTGRGQSNTSK